MAFRTADRPFTVNFRPGKVTVASQSVIAQDRSDFRIFWSIRHGYGRINSSLDRSPLVEGPILKQFKSDISVTAKTDERVAEFVRMHGEKMKLG